MLDDTLQACSDEALLQHTQTGIMFVPSIMQTSDPLLWNDTPTRNPGKNSRLPSKF
jgi:hypothetical protein